MIGKCVIDTYREMAERLVKEVRSEVAIGMEDVTPSLPSSLPGEEKTLGMVHSLSLTLPPSSLSLSSFRV